MMQWYSEDLKVVKDASDLNSSGSLLMKVVEISDSRCFFEVCKLNLSLKQKLCSASSNKIKGSSMENSEPQNAGEVAC